MGYRETFEYWKRSEYFDEETRKELEALTDEKEIEDRFYKDLEFGTAGLRGVMGAGTNRMNRYNIRRATAGFGAFLLKKYGEEAKSRGIAVAYDCRNFSREFALETALVMNQIGIKVYLYSMVSATPLLSYTVRRLRCAGGVVVTSSHNTREYNGYKVYDETGCQLNVDDASAVTEEISGIPVDSVKLADFSSALEQGLLRYIGNAMADEYLEAISSQAHSLSDSAKERIRIVYTPLHGAGRDLVQQILKKQGYSHVSPVEAQCVQDGNFPTVVSPNPEEKTALAMAISQAEKEGADIVIANDPDSDRIGTAVRRDGSYVLITGNQLGALYTDYILERRKDELSENSCIITTIVTGELGPAAAYARGVKTYRVLTGFKHICGLMNRFEKTGEAKPVLGYEESYGYAIGDVTRDKDGVVSALLAAEMAAYYLEKGLTLADVLEDLYAKLGYYLDAGSSYYFTGIEGAEKIRSINSALRKVGKGLMPGICEIKDYSGGLDGLPPTDALKYFFNDGSWLAIRPSGTEPKIKLYYCVRGENKEEAEARLAEIKAVMDAFVNG